MHPRAVSVEDPHNLDPQPVLAPIVEEQGLGATLAFVVAGTQPDRVDVTPVGLDLRMDLGIAVDFGGRGLEDLCLHALGEPKHVDGAMDAGLGGLDRVELVVDRGGRTGQIVDLVHFDIERESHVVTHHLKSGIADQVRDVAPAAGEIVVHAKHVVTLFDEPLAQM